MAVQPGQTGNVQPGLNAGMSLSVALWAHVKLEPMTKAVFSLPLGSANHDLLNVCRSHRKQIYLHNIKETFRQYSNLVNVFFPFFNIKVQVP